VDAAVCAVLDRVEYGSDVGDRPYEAIVRPVLVSVEICLVFALEEHDDPGRLCAEWPNAGP
jgi:hypothetical protein